VVTELLTGEEIAELAREMVAFGEETGKKGFDRDARGVEQSAAVLLIGIDEAASLGLNCGACGFETCAERKTFEGSEFVGGQCAFRHLDMGIAIGSAVKTASMLNVDNRIMYRIGTVARRMGIIKSDFVMGIPLAASGKNVFFDRK
jgi:uncharacterized ferredoxin-like protein